jgi:hypothetical protein
LGASLQTKEVSMSESKPKTKARFKAGFPSIVEVEVTREWDDKSDENLIHYGDKIAILACDGTYWQVNRNDDDKVMALAKHIKEWEFIEIVAVGDEFVSERNRVVKYGDQVAFRFTENGSFVGANLNSGNKELTARAPMVKEWEMFTLLEHPKKKPSKDKYLRYGSWFALRAYNGKHVMFDKNNSKQLLASVPHIDEWEAFVFISPSQT